MERSTLKELLMTALLVVPAPFFAQEKVTAEVGADWYTNFAGNDDFNNNGIGHFAG